MLNLENKKVLITGAGSLIMKPTAYELQQKNAKIQEIFHKNVNLLNYDKTIAGICCLNPEYIIHGSGFNGGISFNQQYPAEIFYRTITMGLNVLQAATLCSTKKIVTLITSCAYEPTPLLKEENFTKGEPHSTVECHGFAKRTLFLYGKQLNKQHKTNIVGVVLNNCYGPGPDYTFSDARGKFLNTLIRRFIEAKKDNRKEIILWGTGQARREVIYCEDAAKGIIEVLEKYEDVNLPINIGCGIDYSIEEIAKKIKEIIEFKGKILWDTTKPDGQMKKLLCVEKMHKLLNFRPQISLEEGIKKTIKFYEDNYVH